MNPYTLVPQPSDIQILIAKNFKKLRKELGYSQVEMAERAGISLGSLKRFEQKGLISLDSLLRLAHLADRLSDFKTLFAPPKDDMKRIEKLFR